jgi:23S rRNA (pseudouridine1915-N3)-methyltransferase
MKLTVITIGTLKEDYLRDAVSEYKKRLMQYAKLDEISLKEEPVRNEDDPSSIAKALDAEADRVISAIPKDSYKIALCVEGKQFTSEQLAGIVKDAADARGKLTLIIGSSHGLSERVKAECDLRLSVSKMTFPHQLMRVVLYEAIYRSFTIIAGKKYHK